ncbi:MAG: hypothetical protein IJ572_00640 [Bacilli bacterium]|nr:hypothetical protein [Bacilli bacterium]
MGNKFTGIKKFLGNKNTVTFFCIILGVLVLYFGYNFRVDKATDPVRIPYAKKTLEKKTKITPDVIGYTQVPRSLITTSKTILTNEQSIINKYVSYSSPIPQNSYFYNSVVMEEEEMPDYAFTNMADGYTVYSLKVNMKETYANKILPNTYIDLYALAVDPSTGQTMFARLIESIRVKAVKDDKGNALLENGVNNGTPAAMLFEVSSIKDNDLFTLLKLAEYTEGVKLQPVPRNAAYTAAAGQTQVDSDRIRQLIYDNAILE